MSHEEVQIPYEIHQINFKKSNSQPLALVYGKLGKGDGSGLFCIALAPIEDAHWRVVDVQTGDPSLVKRLRETEILQPLVDKAASLLETINFWSTNTPGEMSAQITCNQRLAPSDVAGKVFVSYRNRVLSLPVTDCWKDIWTFIEGRAEGDPFFKVQGFSTSEIVIAMANLKTLFPGDWVCAKYRKTSTRGRSPLFSADLPRETDGWFPAYHLARTALGAICIDPGWNYLIELGLSIQDLNGFEKLDELTKKVAKSPGTQHHLCLAAELHRRGHLESLEPPTGSGSATNDLLVAINSRSYEIEVKEFSSQSPVKRLLRELKEKDCKLPSSPTNPVVFHAVISDEPIFNKKREDTFFREIRAITNQIPAKISAIVIGKRFVDASGGRVKRDAECVVLNPNAIQPSLRSDLEQIFAPNYKSIQYPIFGIGSYFEFS